MRRKGQAYVEFILVLPLMLLIIAGIIAFGQGLYVKLATQAAAWAAARHAVATLNPSRGSQQAILAARYALAGFALDPNDARVEVSTAGWNRGVRVAVRVCYDVPPPPVPYGGIFRPLRICSGQTMPIYRWKSRW
ncbi:MAG: pilus assembly protein [Armatimonadota bacterium]|nr:pilus assembly protein [Armatimonadota bacterium]